MPGNSFGLFCMKFKLLSVVALLFAGISGSFAATINAASGSFADVNAAVLKASQGDTVLIPPGTNTWTATLTISGITLQGSGTNNTVIVDETPIIASGN